MSFKMSLLLIHDEHLPAAARDALEAAHRGAPELRLTLLESAAQILHDEAGVECSDARELVDLEPGDCAS
jgi:hypothetical protein